MTDCQVRGCRNLATVCQDCGRTVCTKDLGDQWVSVKDQMPSPYCFVLVCEASGRCGHVSPISIARWEGDVWNGIGEDEGETNGFYLNLFWSVSWNEITHWMPLPEVPEMT